MVYVGVNTSHKSLSLNSADLYSNIWSVHCLSASLMYMRLAKKKKTGSGCMHQCAEETKMNRQVEWKSEARNIGRESLCAGRIMKINKMNARKLKTPFFTLEKWWHSHKIWHLDDWCSAVIASALYWDNWHEPIVSSNCNVQCCIYEITNSCIYQTPTSCFKVTLD